MTPVTDPDLLAKLDGQSGKPVTDPALLAQLNEQPSALMDFLRSFPRGAMTGISKTLSASGQAAQAEMSQPIDVPEPQDVRGVLEKNITGPTYQPQGPAGEFGSAIGEGLATPTSWVGPGSLPLKVGGSVLSSIGGEAGRKAAEGTPYEFPAALGGSVLGGAAAGRMIAPGKPKAAIPTAPELRTAADTGYEAARNTGLELHPSAVSNLATDVEQELLRRGLTPKVAGTTFDVLDELRNPPAGSTVSAANLGALRQNINHIADQLQPSAIPGGYPKPTPDAKAASILASRLRDYLENLPGNSAVAGNPADYVRAIKQANGDFAAGQRVRDFDARLTRAENATDRQVAGSLDSQIKSKAGQMLDNPLKMRGLSDAEKAQVQLINSGGPISNTLRQLGRGGAGVVPLMGHAITAGATGGSLLPYQIPLAAGLYGARKTSEMITKSRANKLVEMLAKRSPEYERRVANLPPHNPLPQRAAVLRGLLSGLQ